VRGWGAILCAIWCVAACAVIGVRTQSGNAFDTDIQSLLPQNALEPLIRAAIRDAGDVASRRVTLLVSGEDPMRVDEAAADLQRSLGEAGFSTDAAGGQALGRWLYANRNSLMCATDPSRFDVQATLNQAQAMLYTPIAPITGEMLAHDPFLLTLQLSQCLAPASGRAGDAVLISGALDASAFRLDVQDKVVSAFQDWRRRWPDVQAARAGAVFFAEDGAKQARNEIGLIGGVSGIAILALLFVCFRRPQAIVGTLAVTAAGAAGSLAAALLVFPSVHVLVFVFGSALIGVTSDYALHYLATGPQTNWAPAAERVKRVSRPLAVCALATALGFASLGAFGVAVFNQVAVFSVAGILTAWWFTVTLLPLMDLRARNGEKLRAWWDRLEKPFLAYRWRRWHGVVAGLLVLAVVGLGVVRFAVLDDVRQFQPRSAQLAAEEERVREAVGFSSSPSFLLSYGADAETARQREEAALAAWPDAAAHDVLAVSRFDPSAARRTQNEAVLRRELYDPHLAARAEELGVAAPAPFAPAQAPELPPLIANLEGQANNAHYLVAPLGPVAAQQGRGGEGALIVDPAARYSQAFASFRGLAGWAVAAAFLVCMLIVLALYRTWRALVVLAAPAAGVLLGLAVPAALGVPLSFFSVAALFVVIGTGIDHSVFLFEAAETDGQTKELVVFLAALTTILSMGMMGLSGTYPVASFGIVVAAGVTAAYLISFVPIRFRGREKRADKQD
jgi:predicted exporter